MTPEPRDNIDDEDDPTCVACDAPVNATTELHEGARRYCARCWDEVHALEDAAIAAVRDDR